MFTSSQIPASVLDAITAPESDTVDIPELVAKVDRDARRFVAQFATGRNLTAGASDDVYYSACEAFFNTFLDRVTERHGADLANRLAAGIDAYLDATGN